MLKTCVGVFWVSLWRDADRYDGNARLWFGCYLVTTRSHANCRRGVRRQSGRVTQLGVAAQSKGWSRVRYLKLRGL
jgi:hypothetical protein